MNGAAMTTYAKARYSAEILEQGFERSPAKGTPFFFLKVRILSRYDDQGQLQDCPQYEREYRQYLVSEVSFNILKGALKTLGYEVNSLLELDPGSPDHVNLVGRKIDMICDLETYQGRQRERWDIPRVREKLDLEGLRALDDKFGRLLGGGKEEGKAPGDGARNDGGVPS
jgi:hypothetical protein